MKALIFTTMIALAGLVTVESVAGAAATLTALNHVYEQGHARFHK